jgi:hypothetical protein
MAVGKGQKNYKKAEPNDPAFGVLLYNFECS